MRIIFALLGGAFFISSCNPVYRNSVLEYEMSNTTFLDTLIISASKTNEYENYREYHGTLPKTLDLLHTDLNLSFDWEEEKVIGQAALLLKPFHYPQDFIEIDCINFSLDSIALFSNDLPLDFRYTYDGEKLKIDPHRIINPNDTLEVFIHYQVIPSSSENHQSNGDDKGLYFVQVDATTKRRKEIWTLGEPQWSAKWFPTINQPNEKATQSISITVDTSLTSISNGHLKSTQFHNNGTKTDHWELSLPHAPYLTAIIVGQFDHHVDSSGTTDLEYFVQPGYKNNISSIFGRVKDMIKFFSDTFLYPFPWPNYKQIIVQDFVTGAMENTTAVIYGDFVQGYENEISGIGNDAIVAHELVHHWFGNLVTCENWANITLNEGFANYGEALWIAHFHGSEAGEYHRYINNQEYFQDAYFSGPLPVISYYYSDPEKLFNTHTYNKGGAILHMLRIYLGDIGFFNGISTYLRENEFSNTEIDHLRWSFEKISGLDLKPFFDQWFFQPGHPRITFESQYDSTSSSLDLTITQENAFKEESHRLFSFPVKIGYVIQGIYKEFDFFMSKGKKQISLDLEVPPELVILDPQRNLLAEFSVDYNLNQWEKIIDLPVNISWKIQAFQSIMLLSDTGAKQKLIRWGLNSSDVFQRLALQAIEDHEFQVFEEKLSNIGTNDKSAEIRAMAWRVLRNISKKGNTQYLINRLALEDSPIVLAEIIETFIALNPRIKQIEFITSLERRPESSITNALGKIYSQRKALDKISFFEEHLYSIRDIHSTNFYESYLSLFPEKGLASIYKIATDKRNSRLRKYGATYAIYQLAKVWTNFETGLQTEANVLLQKILATEKDRTLTDLYFAFK